MQSLEQHKCLIFPGGMEDSLKYLKTHQGEVVGASSLINDPARKYYENWEVLPFVQEPEFKNRFKGLIEAYQITHLFCPHKVIWQYLKEQLPRFCPDVQLLGEPPVNDLFDGHKELLHRVKGNDNQGLKLHASLLKHPSLNLLERCALFQHALQMFGECDEIKISALCEIFRALPDQGDMVEIGSAWGRSGFVLTFLSRYYQLGNVLCIDPWNKEIAMQKEVHPDFRSTFEEVNVPASYDEIMEAFIINLFPYHYEKLNYMRETSYEVVKLYRQPDFVVTSSYFGTTAYQGKIALLHIDGNHDYACVKQDIEDWLPLVVPGGWVLIDDYIWAFGDGPKRAGDEYLVSHQSSIACAFVVGSTLFIKVKE